MLNILFTYSDTPGSKLIREVTGEPVSHCAIYSPDHKAVLHASEYGVICQSFLEFAEENHVKFHVDVGTEPAVFEALKAKYLGKPYDYRALIFLGIRYILTWLHLPCPKVNLWNLSGAFMCTELVTVAIQGTPDSLITPYKLYLELSNVSST